MSGILKDDIGVRRQHEEGMAIVEVNLEIKRARGESMTSWIHRTAAPGATHSE